VQPTGKHTREFPKPKNNQLLTEIKNHHTAKLAHHSVLEIQELE
jgi:hypothetical protein